MNVVILDTGCANLNSVKSAIGRHGYEPVVSRDPEVVLRADKLFLPGVGTAQAAMDQLRDRELIDLIKACTQPVLGICLGMQLLGKRSEENNGVDLLGIIEEDVPKMTDHGLPLPQATVHGDALLITQAIDNLLANALAFCPQGGNIRLSLSSDKAAVRLRIINNGTAIPDYALPRLFERFFSLPRPDGSGRSSGLGLSFVAQIMALHGGSVAVANHADGVVAELVFPATPPKQSS